MKQNTCFVDTRTRQQKLLDNLKLDEGHLANNIDTYINKYTKIDRSWALKEFSRLHEYRALKAYFIDHDLQATKQAFYTTSLLLTASREAGFAFGQFPIEGFLFALLSDSKECINQIINAELEYKDDPKSYHFYSRMTQLLLLDDHETVREMIALGAKKIV